MDELVTATVEELRAVGYDGLTVRDVARRAGVAPATASTYFVSKDHLVTEVSGAAWTVPWASGPTRSSCPDGRPR